MPGTPLLPPVLCGVHTSLAPNLGKDGREFLRTCFKVNWPDADQRPAEESSAGLGGYEVDRANFREGMEPSGGCAKANLAPTADSQERFWANIRVALLASLLWFAALASNAAIAADSGKEYWVKAAFILNFASLIEWPAESFDSSEDPIVICHVGGSQAKSAFDTAYSGRMVERRPIEIRHLSRAGRVSDCHILIITAERGKQAREFIAAAAGKSILTIGETENFARDGGVIGFYKDGPIIRFEVNLRAAESAKLRISSRLLQLARLVPSEDK